MKIKAHVTGMRAAVFTATLVCAAMVSTVVAADIESTATLLPVGIQVTAKRLAPGAGMWRFGEQAPHMAPGRAPGRGARIEARREAMRTRLLDRVDTNGDGSIDEGEFVASHTRHAENSFTRRDLNDDGLLSREEVEARPGRLDRPERPDRPERSGIDRAAVRACVRETIADYDPEPDLEDRFDVIDTNDDGFVDQLELSTALQERAYVQFDRLDADDDGVITLEELETGRQYELNLRRVIHHCIQKVTAASDAADI